MRRLPTGMLCGLLLGVSMNVTPLSAENWPNWRGPTRDGVSSETGLPVEWDTERNIAWKLEMPAWSGSTPAIWNDRIFLNVAVDDENIAPERWQPAVAEAEHVLTVANSGCSTGPMERCSGSGT